MQLQLLKLHWWEISWLKFQTHKHTSHPPIKSTNHNHSTSTFKRCHFVLWNSASSTPATCGALPGKKHHWISPALLNKNILTLASLCGAEFGDWGRWSVMKIMLSTALQIFCGKCSPSESFRRTNAVIVIVVDELIMSGELNWWKCFWLRSWPDAPTYFFCLVWIVAFDKVSNICDQQHSLTWRWGHLQPVDGDDLSCQHGATQYINCHKTYAAHAAQNPDHKAH